MCGGELFRPFYRCGEAAILMFDVGSRITYKSLPKWHADVKHVCRDDIPIVVCGNKCEGYRKVEPHHITYPQKKGLQYYDISAKTHYNLVEPFLWLARKLTGDNNLQFIFKSYPKNSPYPKNSLANLCRSVVLDNLSNKDDIITIMSYAHFHDDDGILDACFKSIRRNRMYEDLNFVRAVVELCQEHFPNRWSQAADILFAKPFEAFHDGVATHHEGGDVVYLDVDDDM